MSWHRGSHQAVLLSLLSHHYQVYSVTAPQLVSLLQLAPSSAACRYHNWLQKLRRRQATSCSHRWSDIYHSSPPLSMQSNRKEQILCSRNLGMAVRSGMSATLGGRMRWQSSVHQVWVRAESPSTFMLLSWKHHLRKVTHLLLTYRLQGRMYLNQVQTYRWCPWFRTLNRVYFLRYAPTFIKWLLS